MSFSLPMWLTLSRIFAIPVIVALFWLDGDLWRYVACGVYAIAAATDWLDGYLARAWALQSKLGRIFDPIADKLLVAATILLLVAFGRVEGFTVLAALVILLREVLVSGLREFLAEIRVGLPVSKLAKWKTGIQMTALGFLIVGDAAPTAMLPVLLVGEIGLWIAAALTLYTGYDYLATGLKHVDEESPQPPAKPAAKPAAPARQSV
ncbi:MAG: CDP-diacylglycerol--glycerol-3-phosphate 3-phosphatidyltransferase [Telmatospirillum sp.]|nr:CDP-diacylglycerol--glycerol-3-phosphate 3-phosphatidyltransferase [Telmatospirillum sp.]